MTNPYVTPAEFRSFGLSAAATSAYSDSDLLTFLEAASEIADSYIRSQYALPLLTWGSDLKIAVCQVASLLILTHRGFDPANPADAAIVNADCNARKWLTDVSKGVANLNVVATAPTARAAATVYSRPPRGW